MNKYTISLGMLFSLLFVVVLSACNSTPADQTPTEQPASPAAESNQGGQDWPEEINSTVPRFTAGRLDEVNSNLEENNLTWVMKFSNTSQDDVAAYRDVLSRQGFKPSSMPLNNNSTMIVGLKEGFTVTINFKDGLTTVGVNHKK